MRTLKSRIGSLLYQSREMFLLKWIKLNCPLTRSAVKKISDKQLIYGLNISSKYRYVYVGNPKTGGSSLKSAMVELEIRNSNKKLDYHNLKTFRDRNISPLERLDELPTNAPLTFLVNNRYKFVTMVRNPYTRLISCYRDKIINNNQQKAGILRILGYDHNKLDRHIEFREFVSAVIGQSDYEMDPHWRVQTSQVLYGILPYSFIGRFENYHNDFKGIFREIGLEESEIPNLRHLHISKSQTDEGCSTFYSADLQDSVYKRYRQDFEVFGYNYELPE